MSIDLRQATPADAPAVADLVRAAYEHYVPLLGMRPRPMDADYVRVIAEQHVLVAHDADELVGVLVLAIEDGAFWIENVAVLPSRRGAGLGRALLQRAEVEAREAGFDTISLYTHRGMSENRARYARAGYEQYDERDVRVFLRKRV